MPPRTRYVCVVAAMLVLAGCGGFFGGDRSVAPITPAPVPTDRPPSAATVPGLSADGLENPLELGHAHDAILDNTSYTRIEKTVIIAPNGTTLASITSRQRVAANGTTVSHSATNGSVPWLPQFLSPSGLVGIDSWLTEDRFVIARRFRGGHTTYRVLPSRVATSIRVSMANSGDRIATLFIPNSTSVTGPITTNGTVRYRVTGTRIWRSSPLVRAPTANITNTHITALVTPGGLITRIHWQYAFRYRGRLVTVRTTIRYTNVGTTTVERPDWVDEALARRGENTTETTAR